MNPASNNLLNTFLKVEVLLDLGSNSNSFFYLDRKNLGVEVGDIVSVRLKGRLLNGLAISKNSLIKNINEQDSNEIFNQKLLSIESIVQKKVIQNWWREWLEELAQQYRVSSLKMFKTAFPPGWIGKYKKINQNLKSQIWVEPHKRFNTCNKKLTERESSLIKILHSKGNWQSELLKYGFNSTLINSMVSKNLLTKSKREKKVNSKLNSFNSDSSELKRPNLSKDQKKYMKNIKKWMTEMSYCFGVKQDLVKLKFI